MLFPFSNRLSRGFLQDMQSYAKGPFQHSNGSFYNLQVCITLDKKALQSLSGLGCESFVTGYFCSYCDVKGSEKNGSTYYRCSFCVRYYDPRGLVYPLPDPRNLSMLFSTLLI